MVILKDLFEKNILRFPTVETDYAISNKTGKFISIRSLLRGLLIQKASVKDLKEISGELFENISNELIRNEKFHELMNSNESDKESFSSAEEDITGLSQRGGGGETLRFIDWIIL